MKKILLLLLLSFLCPVVHSQDSLGNIIELQKLLKERKDKFEDYASSADKRSGIFKMKTKKDLEASREILLQIVKTDNHIFSALSSAISHRGMAKSDYSYDELNYKQTIDRLSLAADTLNKQLVAEKELHAANERKAGTLQWIVYVLAGIVVLLTVAIFIRRR